MDRKLIEIDGSHGEGGGQVLRTSLALSSILGVPVRIDRIRANRKSPGLKPQHLSCVQALLQITAGKASGAKIDSTSLAFQPKDRRAGRYAFNVADIRPSAGSVALIVQAILPSLILADGPSEVVLRGGTHVEWSPPYNYLESVFLPTVEKMGVNVRVKLNRWGWYPKGGGEVVARVEPVGQLRPINLPERGRLTNLKGISAISNLKPSIAERQRRQAEKILRQAGYDPRIEAINAQSIGQGTLLFLLAEFENTVAGFSSLGRIGKRAEEVAEEACQGFFGFMETDGAIEGHLADQLIVYMALAKGTSSFTTSEITQHLLTNSWVVEHFLPAKLMVEGQEGQPGKVTKVDR